MDSQIPPAETLETYMLCNGLNHGPAQAIESRNEKGTGETSPFCNHGADNGARTRDPNLGKVVLYQLSHVRMWWAIQDLNL